MKYCINIMFNSYAKNLSLKYITIEVEIKSMIFEHFSYSL